MPPDSWIEPDTVPTLAAEAMARIDTALARLPAPERDAFWASVRKCYNTPYNDPKPRVLPRVRLGGDAADRPGHVSMAAIPVPASLCAESHAV